MPAIPKKNPLTHRRYTAWCCLFFLLFSLIEINAIGQNSVKNSYANLRMNEVNVHAVRHFLDNFSQASGVIWNREDDYFVASFHAGHSIDKAYYKINGNFAFCIKHYLAEDLEGGLKSAVLKEFPGSQIMLVTELTNLDSQTYYINIKCGVFIKTLRCNDEGIEIMESITDAGI
jgi:hypothetical protein